MVNWIIYLIHPAEYTLVLRTRDILKLFYRFTSINLLTICKDFKQERLNFKSISSSALFNECLEPTYTISSYEIYEAHSKIVILVKWIYNSFISLPVNEYIVYNKNTLFNKKIIYLHSLPNEQDWNKLKTCKKSLIFFEW